MLFPFSISGRKRVLIKMQQKCVANAHSHVALVTNSQIEKAKNTSVACPTLTRSQSVHLQRAELLIFIPIHAALVSRFFQLVQRCAL